MKYSSAAYCSDTSYLPAAVMGNTQVVWHLGQKTGNGVCFDTLKRLTCLPGKS